MLHGIYCFPFFHPNRPFIVFPPLSSVSLPHSPVLRQLILSYSPCSQPRYSYVVFFFYIFYFHIKTHRATPWPSDSHHQKTHLCRCRYTHLDLQTGLTQCFHSHPHGVRRRWDAISCVTVTVEMQSRHHHFLSLSLWPVFDRLRC